jgi:hypothetical protein
MTARDPSFWENLAPYFTGKTSAEYEMTEVGEEALRRFFPDGLPAVPVVGPSSPIPSHLLRAAE